MKILSVFMSVLLIFSLCFTANAAETAVVDTYPLGDATYDGAITAEDARLILRLVVGLEMVPALNLFYSDCDFDGVISAADSRLALRISVGLEEKQSYAFDITESKPPKCSEEGHIKAVCAITGKEACMIRDKMPHTMPQDIGCTGKGNCLICGEEVTAEINHRWAYSPWENMRECYDCGVRESFIHVHKFSDTDHYCDCGVHARSIFVTDMKEYLLENGTHLEDEYYIDDYIEKAVFALVYNEKVDLTYAFYGFSVISSDGITVDYEFEFNFEADYINAKLYAEDLCVAMVSGLVAPEKVTGNTDGDAITIIGYDVMPQFTGMEVLFRILMEGAVYGTVKWITETAPSVGCTYTEHLFAEYVNVK